MPVDTAPCVFQRWKSVRDGLACTINDYLDASTELCNTLSSSVQPSFLRSELEQTLSALDLELNSLCLDEGRLKQTRIAITRERNKAHSVVPIHRLPHEILATIFAVSTNQYIEYNRVSTWSKKGLSPAVLAGVCTLWRDLALGTPSIWSHINIVVAPPLNVKRYKQAALWAERSKKLPLYMEIYDLYYKPQQHMFTGYEISQLTGLLVPLMARVYALEMRCSKHSVIISPVMECWIKSGSTITNKTVQIINHDGEDDTPVIGPSNQISPEEFNVFFQSVRRVALHNCLVSELVSFHDGLVELCLERSEDHLSYTQQHLYAIFSATPRLRRLLLLGCCVEPSEVLPPLITLNYLDSLCIESLNVSFSLAYVLPLVHTTSPSLDLILTLDITQESIDAVQEFCGRTRVTRLLVKGFNDNPPNSPSLRTILCPMAHLETLAIEGFDISDDVFHIFLSKSDAGHSQAPWSRLHTLYLKHVDVIDINVLERLSIVCPLGRLHMVDCWTTQKDKMVVLNKDLEELKELMGMVAEFEICSELDKWPVNDWDFSILE